MASILIIDDDVAVARLLGEALAKAGHAVKIATGGSAGLQYALRTRPEVIVCDVVMPGLDGWGVLRTLRARKETARIPVIFLTQLDGMKDRLQGLEMGAEDYLTKPFHPEELVLRVRNLLARQAKLLAEARVGSSSDMAGRLEHIGLAALLSLLEGERASGVLCLVRGDKICELSLLGGKVLQGVLRPDSEVQDIDAVAAALSWADGEFSFDSDEVLVEDRIGMGTTGLLMEAARRLDEAGR